MQPFTPIENVRNQYAHKLCTYFIFPDGSSKILFEGQEYTEDAFNKAFPRDKPKIEVFDKVKHLKGSNPDQTRSWMN